MALVKILYVDDEENNLRSFKANFRRLYEIYTATSGREALDILAHTDVHVIISDQRMPEMTGVQLFKKVKQLYPGPIRILLTGYTDIEALADAVNGGDIFRYITKPWNEVELINAIQNASEMFRTRQDLKDKLTELQKTNDELNRFIYSISHELRAPLASVLGVINLAKLDNVTAESEKSREYWGMMEDCCNRLDYNITSTLQYYKNSRYTNIKEEIDFEKLVQGLIGIHKLANDADNTVSFEVVIEQPEKFVGDLFRIEIIIGNLISNAIKYQKPDEEHKLVRIEVKVNRLDAIITVTDNGVGIMDNHMNDIFNQFFRASTQKGTGLGLFIVKEALTKLDGKITVESAVNSGSKFTLRIPNDV